MSEHQEFENDHSSNPENAFGPDQGFETSGGGDEDFSNDQVFDHEEPMAEMESASNRSADFDEDVTCEVTETSDDPGSVESTGVRRIRVIVVFL